MTFARIEMLFLVWSLPVLFLFFLHGMHRRRGILDRFASGKGQGAILSDSSRERRWVKAGLILMSLLFTAVALSGPRYGFRWQTIERKGIDIIVALDCSKSMLAQDVSPTRLDRAKREVYDLLALLQGDRIGLVAFAGTAFLQCPLTLDYSAVHLFLETLSPEGLPVGGSDLGAAITASLSAFDARGSREKAVILITDGEETGPAGDFPEAVDAARDAGATLFCIGVGTREGIPVPDPAGGFLKDPAGKVVVSRLAEEPLRQAAEATGGVYVISSAGDMDLDLVYTRKIRGRMDMEMETLQGGRKQVWEDRYQWVLFLAAAALAAEMCLPHRRRRGGAAGRLAVLMLILFPQAAPAHADDLRDGASAYRREAYDDALKHFIDAQLDDPDAPEILYNIGATQYRLGDFEAAAKSLEAAAAADSEVRRDALFNLGNAHFRRQAFEQAIENYEAVLKLAPDDRDAAENLAFARKMLAARERQESRQEGQGDPKAEPGEKPGAAPPEGADPGDEEGASPPEASPQDPSPSASPAEAGQGKREAAREPSGTGGPGMAPREGAPGEEGPDTPDPGREAPARGQAERMLNRLKDQPGRALMPHYGKRAVDRDW